MSWLANVLAEQPLTEDVEGYLLGRGAQEESFRELGVVTWQADYTGITDEAFLAKYGTAQDRLDLTGWLICPIWSPKGKVIGFEARNTTRKALSEFVLPEATWNPIWLGLSPNAMRRIWAGGDVWVVEGLFDLFPLQWAVPKTDVVLATLRARLTDKHVGFLHRFCQGRVHMVYDQDEQGRKATHGWVDQEGRKRWGALQKLERVGVRCRDVPFSGGKDPGEIWDHGGARAVQAAFRIAA